jgi:hypothetical protein
MFRRKTEIVEKEVIQIKKEPFDCPTSRQLDLQLNWFKENYDLTDAYWEFGHTLADTVVQWFGQTRFVGGGYIREEEAPEKLLGLPYRYADYPIGWRLVVDEKARLVKYTQAQADALKNCGKKGKKK